MDESNIRGMKLLDLNDREELKLQELKDERIRRRGIFVHGYDPLLRGDELANALRSHFSSCGEIQHVTLPINEHFYTSYSKCTLHIRGHNTERKVLELNGSYMGGWKLAIQIPPMPPPPLDYTGSSVILASGFDRSLPETKIETLVTDHFSSCVEVLEAVLLYNKVRVIIKGEDALEKALSLRSCKCNVKDCKIVAEKRDP